MESSYIGLLLCKILLCLRKRKRSYEGMGGMLLGFKIYTSPLFQKMIAGLQAPAEYYRIDYDIHYR